MCSIFLFLLTLEGHYPISVWAFSAKESTERWNFSEIFKGGLIFRYITITVRHRHGCHNLITLNAKSLFIKRNRPIKSFSLTPNGLLHLLLNVAFEYLHYYNIFDFAILLFFDVWAINFLWLQVGEDCIDSKSLEKVKIVAEYFECWFTVLCGCIGINANLLGKIFDLLGQLELACT